jgi:LppC putative lipoprotein
MSFQLTRSDKITIVVGIVGVCSAVLMALPSFCKDGQELGVNICGAFTDWIKANGYTLSVIFYLSLGAAVTLLIQRYFRKPIIQIPIRTRVAIMLPLKSDDKSVKEDVKAQLEGFTQVLMKEPDITHNFDFHFYNHHADFDHNVKAFIQRELDKGTNYFICTMGQVCVGLSKHFIELVDQNKNKTNSPILICTIAASNEVQTQKNKVYQFYIQANDDVHKLVEKAKLIGLKEAICIGIDSSYGRSIDNAITTLWTQPLSKKSALISVKKDANVQSFINSMAAHIKQHDAIFVAAYGDALKDIIRGLKGINLPTTSKIFITSTINVKTWQKDILSDLMALQCYYSKPTIPHFQNDIIADFVCQTILRLKQSLENPKDKTKTFDDQWSLHQKNENSMAFSNGKVSFPMSVEQF